jgi:hypothetical protein
MLTIQAHLRLNMNRVIHVEENPEKPTHLVFQVETQAAHRFRFKAADRIEWWPQEGSPRDLDNEPRKSTIRRKRKSKIFDVRRSLDSSSQITDFQTHARKMNLMFAKKEEVQMSPKRYTTAYNENQNSTFLQWNKKVKVHPTKSIR